MPEIAEPAPKNVLALPRYTLTEARALLGFRLRGESYTTERLDWVTLVLSVAEQRAPGAPRLSFESLVTCFLKCPPVLGADYRFASNVDPFEVGSEPPQVFVWLFVPPSQHVSVTSRRNERARDLRSARPRRTR